MLLASNASTKPYPCLALETPHPTKGLLAPPPFANLSTSSLTAARRGATASSYDGEYGDGSFTSGILATETFAFASPGEKPLSIPNILFGNGGLFSGAESGIVGLGGGKASFITQLGFLAQGKFSYCLVPITGFSNSSKLHFGAKAKVSGSGVVSTPLVVKKGLDTFYFLAMEGISIGNERMDFPSSRSRAN